MTSAVLDKTKIATVAGSITVYNFAAQTGEYTGSSEEYLAVGVGLPAHSTDIAPGVAGDGYVMVFAEQAWSRQEDHRGETVYSTADRSASTIDYIGAIKDGFTSVAPASIYDSWNGSAWVTDTSAQHAAAVSAATLHAQQLVDAAMQSVSVIQLKLQAGRTLTDSEKARLNAVLDYIDEVSATDISAAPVITWPPLPV